MSRLRYLLTSNFPQAGNEYVASYLRNTGVTGPIAWMAPLPDAQRFEIARRQFTDGGPEPGGRREGSLQGVGFGPG